MQSMHALQCRPGNYNTKQSVYLCANVSWIVSVVCITYGNKDLSCVRIFFLPLLLWVLAMCVWNTFCSHQLSGWILFLHFFTMGEYYSAFAIFCNRQNTFTTGEILFTSWLFGCMLFCIFYYFFHQVKYFLLTLTIWVNVT